MTARPEGAERVYRGLLSLYPTDFRRRFGEDMVQLFHDRLRDARSGQAAGGAVVAWTALLADAVVTASLEHLRRNRTVAHSLAPRPSVTTRVLGLAGIGAGLVILVAFVVSLPEALYFWRLVVFELGLIAIGIGIHLRQSQRAPTVSLGVTVVLVAASLGYLIALILVPPGNIAAFWAGVALWLASALFGATSAVIGAVSRIGAWAVAVGSLLTFTGMDRLGLVSEGQPTVFNTLSLIGIAVMAFGWIVLGLDVALRRSDGPEIV